MNLFSWNVKTQAIFRRIGRPTRRPSRTHARNISGGHQQMRLVGFQRFGRLTGFRPPHKTAFGEPLLCQPAALPVISEEPDRRPAAAPEYKYTTGERIFRQFVLAQSHQRIDPFAPIHRLDGNQHTHLRRDLDHRSPSRQARNRFVQFGGVLDLHRTRILPPCADSNSMTHSSISAGCGLTSSTNAGPEDSCRCPAPLSRCFSLV